MSMDIHLLDQAESDIPGHLFIRHLMLRDVAGSEPTTVYTSNELVLSRNTEVQVLQARGDFSEGLLVSGYPGEMHHLDGGRCFW